VNNKGEASVSLKTVPKDHPLARASGSDNILLFRTKRYDQQPMVIQGPGAGPDVTAAGVFAELLRLSTYLGAPQ
jgi:aspartokinase/homoserine dehydrogenase 1